MIGMGRGSPAVRRVTGFVAAGFLVLGLAYLVASRSATSLAAPPPGSFAFAVLGDAPYDTWEELRYRSLLEDLDATELAWVIHVGDIFWRPCTEDMYLSRLKWYRELRHPLILTLGDNEWADCHEPRSGAYEPLKRLTRMRQIFYAEPTKSLGARSIALESQGASAEYPEFVENARWERDGIVFVTVHLIGSANGRVKFSDRTAADDAESVRRTEAAAAWLRESFALARERGARAVFVAFHADAHLELPLDAPGRVPWDPFILALEEEAEAYAGLVVFAHGDSHEYRVDQPLVRRTTGKVLANVTRMEVPGSPDVGWVRVIVSQDPNAPFRYEVHLVPRWRVW